MRLFTSKSTYSSMNFSTARLVVLKLQSFTMDFPLLLSIIILCTYCLKYFSIAMIKNYA